MEHPIIQSVRFALGRQMKRLLPLVALAVASVELAAQNQEAAAVAATVTIATGRGGASAAVPARGAGGSSGMDANWYLRAPDGSYQGPYGLSQLRDWSNAGYVPLGETCRIVEMTPTGDG